MNGTVKWFNHVKGHGFIIPDDDIQDEVFVHHTGILGEGFVSLRQNQRVSFKLTANGNHKDGRVRYKATQVTTIKDQSAPPVNDDTFNSALEYILGKAGV